MTGGLFLTFTTLLANSTDDKLTIFFLFFPDNMFDISCQLGDGLHKMSNKFSEKNKKNISKCLLKYYPAWRPLKMSAY